MNAKTAKLLRNLVGFKPNDTREYGPLESQDHNGQAIKIETTAVAKGKRADYRLLKRYFKGYDVILPNHLRSLVGES